MNNRIKHYMDDLGIEKNIEYPMCSPPSSDIAKLESFVNAVEDMVCEAMGEAFCEGKLFGINIMINPETKECRIWRCDV